MKRILIPSIFAFCFALLMINVWTELSFSQSSAVSIQPSNAEAAEEITIEQATPKPSSSGSNSRIGRSRSHTGGMMRGMGGMGDDMGGYGMMMGGAMGMGSQDLMLRVFQLEHRQAQDIANFLIPIFSRHDVIIQPDPQQNSLIIAANEESNALNQIEQLIKQLDREVKAPQKTDAMSLMYRVYAVEMGQSQKEDIAWHQFELVFQSDADDNHISKLTNFRTDHLVITQFQKQGQQHLIRGITQPDAHNLEGIIEGIVKDEVQIITSNFASVPDGIFRPAPAKPNIEMPGNIQNAVQKFLGNSTEVTGYWFGNASVPGETKVQLGDYQLSIKSQSVYDDKFSATIRYAQTSHESHVPDKWREKVMQYDEMQRQYGQNYSQNQPNAPRGGRSSSPGQSGANGIHPPQIARTFNYTRSEDKVVLENTVNCQIGQPVIIGYSREGTGSISQGALVLIPESSETLQMLFNEEPKEVFKKKQLFEGDSQ